VASGDDKRYEKARELLKSDFVVLNVYPKSVKDEHEPRGPKGPFQFMDRSVPVLIMKSSKGETLYRQLGWFAGQPGIDRFTEAVREARKNNGPVNPPAEKTPSPPAKVERWTSNDGKVMTATLLSFDAEQKKAVFRLRNGRSSTIPLTRFSDESRARILKRFPPKEGN